MKFNEENINTADTLDLQHAIEQGLMRQTRNDSLSDEKYGTWSISVIYMGFKSIVREGVLGNADGHVYLITYNTQVKNYIVDMVNVSDFMLKKHKENILKNYTTKKYNLKPSNEEINDKLKGIVWTASDKNLINGYMSENKTNIWEAYDNSVLAITKGLHATNIDQFIGKAKDNNLGYERDYLPQINDIDGAVNHLMFKWDAKKGRMKIKNLKASQQEFNKDKVRGMVYDNEYDPFDRIYFVDEQDRLLDGHHSWIYGNVVDPEHYVHVVRVPLPFNRVRNILNRLKSVTQKSITEMVEAHNALVEKQVRFMGYQSLVLLPKSLYESLYTALDVLEGYELFAEGTQAEYQDFLNGKLKDEGYKSMADIPKDKSKAFWAMVKKEYAGGKEDVKEEGIATKFLNKFTKKGRAANDVIKAYEIEDAELKAKYEKEKLALKKKKDAEVEALKSKKTKDSEKEDKSDKETKNPAEKPVDKEKEAAKKAKDKEAEKAKSDKEAEKEKTTKAKEKEADGKLNKEEELDRLAKSIDPKSPTMKKLKHLGITPDKWVRMSKDDKDKSNAEYKKDKEDGKVEEVLWLVKVQLQGCIKRFLVWWNLPRTQSKQFSKMLSVISTTKKLLIK